MLKRIVARIVMPILQPIAEIWRISGIHQTLTHEGYRVVDIFPADGMYYVSAIPTQQAEPEHLTEVLQRRGLILNTQNFWWTLSPISLN